MIVDVMLYLLALPVALIAGYLAFLAALARVPGRGLAPALADARFDLIVPAHDEASVIGRTAESLRAIRYPRSQFRVIVIADNCTDDTAQRARDAGATVWERTSDKRGKGYALRFAFDRSLAEGFADAVVVIDADAVANPELLSAFAAGLRRGELALQAFNGVLNVHDSWRTRLMTLAFCLFNGMRSLARERLGLSAGLGGNGMCFSRSLLEQHPYDAFSLVEDLEYGLRLSLAGVRVAYIHEAEVRSDIPTGERAARSQRQRWEEGRRQLVREHLFSTLLRGWRERNGLVFDAGMNLLVPPLAKIVLATTAGLAASSSLLLATGRWPYSLGVYALCALFLLFYVVRGWALSGTGAAGLTALLRAPLYVGWKLALGLSSQRKSSGWVRTAREGTGGARQ